jgi:hypothetical protein
VDLALLCFQTWIKALTPWRVIHANSERAGRMRKVRTVGNSAYSMWKR